MWLLAALPLELPRAERFDDALMRRAAGGDVYAQRALYDLTRGAVYGFALSMLRNRHDAEDVMQESYVKLLSSLSQYRAMGKPMAWVMSIVRSQALMKLRAGRREQAAEPGVLESVAADAGMPHEERILLEASLRELSDEERQVVTLHALSGLRHREIAELLALPLSTVLSKYTRALRKLRRALEEGDRA